MSDTDRCCSMTTSSTALIHSQCLNRVDDGPLLPNLMPRVPKLSPLARDKGYGSIFTSSTHSPHWRAVRKGASPAFSPKALR